MIAKGRHQQALIALPRGTLLKPQEAARMAGYRRTGPGMFSDGVDSARRRLARLSELGYFRYAGGDMWERM